MISIYDSKETVFMSNGLVVLSDAISCPVTEELNGAYELTLEYPLDERGKWLHLVEGNIIKADGQLFRIYHKQKTLQGIKVNARHIFYDLYDNFLEDARPTNQTGTGALDWILTHTQYPHSFTSVGDVVGSLTQYFVKKNPVEAIMGDDGLIANWGGEIERDNFIIRYMQARGLDRGVLISYGKNIIGIEETIDLDAVCTRMMPVGKDGLLLTEKYVDSPYINNYPHPKVRTYEFNDCETEEALRTAAQGFMTANKIDIPLTNYKIDFIELSKTEEYKNYAVLERVYMGDTVTIRHSMLGIDLKAKVIRIKKNVLTGRIENVELGSFRPNIGNSLTNLTSLINEVSKAVVLDKSDWQKAVNDVTTLLTTSLGGYVVKKENEILIMDTTDEMTAIKVWRWNLNGLGYSSTGINGPFETAMTMDGHIVGSFISGLLGQFVEVEARGLSVKDLNSVERVKIGDVSPLQDGSAFGLILRNNNNETVIADGIVQTDTIQLVDNVDAGYGLALKFYVDDDVISIRKVKLAFTLENFRAYEKGANTWDGQTTSSTSTTNTSQTKSSETSGSYNGEQTTSAGGASTYTDNGGSSNYNSTDSSYISGNTDTAYTDSYGGYHSHSVGSVYSHSHYFPIPNHQHQFTAPSHSHNFSLPGHTHNVTIDGHSHDVTVTIPGHGHDLIYGIFEKTNTVATGVKIYIDGTLRDSTGYTTGQSNISLEQWITTSGWHTVYLTSTALGRINASLYVKSYVAL